MTLHLATQSTDDRAITLAALEGDELMKLANCCQPLMDVAPGLGELLTAAVLAEAGRRALQGKAWTPPPTPIALHHFPWTREQLEASTAWARRARMNASGRFADLFAEIHEDLLEQLNRLKGGYPWRP